MPVKFYGFYISKVYLASRVLFITSCINVCRSDVAAEHSGSGWLSSERPSRCRFSESCQFGTALTVAEMGSSSFPTPSTTSHLFYYYLVNSDSYNGRSFEITKIEAATGSRSHSWSQWDYLWLYKFSSVFTVVYMYQIIDYKTFLCTCCNRHPLTTVFWPEPSRWAFRQNEPWPLAEIFQRSRTVTWRTVTVTGRYAALLWITLMLVSWQVSNVYPMHLMFRTYILLHSTGPQLPIVHAYTISLSPTRFHLKIGHLGFWSLQNRFGMLSWF